MSNRNKHSAPRVVYIHQYFVTPEQSGGTRSYEFGRRLASAGYDVHIVTARNSPSKNWTVESVAGMTVHACTIPYSNQMNFAARIQAFVKFALLAGRRSRTLKPDIIFATSTPLTIIFPALQARLFRKVPLIFEVRDLWPELPIAVGALKNPLVKSAARILEKIAYRSANHIIALSPGMAAGIRRVAPSKEISIVPNSSDVQLFQSIPEEEVAKWLEENQDWLRNRKLVLYAGTFGLINQVTYLAEVAREVMVRDKGIVFLAVGGGADEQEVQSRASELGVLNHNFYIRSRIPKIDLISAFRVASVSTSLFAPIKEMESNSANKFFDTLAAGTPIAINYSGWQADLIKEHGLGLVLSRDPRLAADELIRFIHNDEKRLSAQSACLTVAKNEFDRDVLFEIFVKPFRMLTGRK